ncbi:MAG: aminotransferase class III-fold pyridoxal phosphate-dependent enzyme [Alphaproteobacteria bacterium]|jgi:adenosylmethionine-8-amino-7-oxononanoate aminotransferase|nr:aminotransferase class III-fold pyridoxal phosphate-dependent enzyme [Alphaproteobacteria bacterium]
MTTVHDTPAATTAPAADDGGTAGPARPRSHLFYQTRQRRPVVARAEGIHLWDVDGNRWIDGSSGAMVANIGHSNPRVTAAMKAQIDRATFAYRLHFENEPAEALAAEVATLMPGDLDRVFFVSGGSEAVESAIKLARQWAVATGRAGRYKIISRFPSYHGATLGALALTGYAPMTAPFAPMMVEMPKIPAPAVWRDRDGLSPDEAGRRYADLLEAEILRQGPETVLGFIVEPIGGASTGALVPPSTYLPRIAEICERFGILLIHDEVMTGAGRTGRFLGADHWDVVPDIAVLSKGFASGYAPLGAMVAPARLVEPVLEAGGFIHGYTYAGNPLACAAGRAVLHEILEQDLIGNAARMGTRLLDQLEGLRHRFPFIGDARGKGLLTAIELVGDPETADPLPAELNAHARLVEAAYARGLILYSRRSRGGYSGDHVIVAPPMIVTAAEIDEIVHRLDAALADLARQLDLPTG